jgi:hypothetical protein
MMQTGKTADKRCGQKPLDKPTSEARAPLRAGLASSGGTMAAKLAAAPPASQAAARCSGGPFTVSSSCRQQAYSTVGNSAVKSLHEHTKDGRSSASWSQPLTMQPASKLLVLQECAAASGQQNMSCAATPARSTPGRAPASPLRRPRCSGPAWPEAPSALCPAAAGPPLLAAHLTNHSTSHNPIGQHTPQVQPPAVAAAARKHWLFTDGPTTDSTPRTGSSCS